MERIEDTLAPVSLKTFESVFHTLTKETASDQLLTGIVEVNLPGISVSPLPIAIRLQM